MWQEFEEHIVSAGAILAQELLCCPRVSRFVFCLLFFLSAFFFFFSFSVFMSHPRVVGASDKLVPHSPMHFSSSNLGSPNGS